MWTLLKIVASLAIILVALLVAAAGLEIAYGEPRPGFVQPTMWAIATPLLWLLWRSKRRQTPTRQQSPD